MGKVLNTLFVCCVLSLPVLGDQPYSPTTCQTYFSYSDEDVDQLKKLHSNRKIQASSLQQIDQKIDDLVKQKGLDYYESVRLFTYLYAAERDAAFISFKAKNDFEGSLEPLAHAIVSLFFKDLPKQDRGDLYSEKLASLVFPKYQERFENESRRPFAYKVPSHLKENSETSYGAGLNCAKWFPWIAKPMVKYYPLPPPPQSAYKEQIEGIKEAQKDLDDEKRHAIYLWAGLVKSGADDWRNIGNAYFFSHPLPLSALLFIRSQLMFGLYDATIVYMNAKYRYYSDRPKVKDRSVNYVIEVPKHSSYPSGHSTLGATAETILSFYLPENRTEWNRLAEESRMSRVWAGIHYPIDNEAGKRIGEKVGAAVIDFGKSLHCN